MSNAVVINAEVRDRAGKGAARAVRAGWSGACSYLWWEERTNYHYP